MLIKLREPYASDEEWYEAMSKLMNLFERVHKRTGGQGLDIQTFGQCRTVEIRWRRMYEDVGLSDERWVSADSLHGALQEVLTWEDEADKADSLEENE